MAARVDGPMTPSWVTGWPEHRQDPLEIDGGARPFGSPPAESSHWVAPSMADHCSGVAWFQTQKEDADGSLGQRGVHEGDQRLTWVGRPSGRPSGPPS